MRCILKPLVTGAGGLICGAMARAFAQSGAKVAALDLNEEAVKSLAAELRAEGFICEGYKANVLEAEALEEVHQAVLKDLGPCDILVNGAGGNNPRATTDNEYHHEAKEGGKSFFDMDASGVDFVFKLNFQGNLLPTQVFAKDMVEKKSGNILNISSMNAYTPLTKIPAYSAAKAGISNFTQWLATHFAGTGIRCNAIAPGFLVSAQNKALLFNEDGTPTARSAKILKGTPMDRFVDAEELLGGMLFLCDDVSASAIDMAKANAARNGLDGKMDFVVADVFDLLPKLEAEGKKPYDFIILDPPAFTKSRKTVKNAEKGYKEINLRALRLLPRGGYFATASCSHFMPSELFVKMLKSAALDAGVELRQIEARQQSPDHPILWNVPETDYLKFYLFQVV